jgi:hypothetical protein
MNSIQAGLIVHNNIIFITNIHSKIFQNENIKKRFRSTNFSSEEKHLIFTLVDKYRHIIENKKTDSTTCHDKAKTWKQIETEFNARLPNSCRRNSESLKKILLQQKKGVTKIRGRRKKRDFVNRWWASKTFEKRCF